MQVHTIAGNEKRTRDIESVSDPFPRACLLIGINANPDCVETESAKWFSLVDDSVFVPGIIPGKDTLCLWSNRMIIREDPNTWYSTSSGSGACYPAYLDDYADDLRLGRHRGGCLLQLIDAREHPVCTSWHLHKRTTEHFYPLVGISYVRGNPHLSPLQWSHVILPLCLHSLCVEYGIAVTLIHMECNLPVLSKEDHFYQSAPSSL